MSADSRGEVRWRASSVFLLLAAVALLIARIPLMGVRVFDADEFEHAHAAWSVFRGLLPYRDFFEHHTPWYYFALSPFFSLFAVDQSFDGASRFLVFARGLSLALTALSAFLMFLVGRLAGDRVGSRKIGLLAALFLVGQPAVIQKMLEIRPDVPALPFFLGGLWFLLRGLRDDGEDPASPRLRWFLGGGLCLGAALMCTQKMLFVLPGALAGLGLWALAGGRQRFVARSLAVAAVVAGIAIPVGITWIAFAAQGAGDPFIRNNFITNAHWRLRSNRHLLFMLQTSWPILVLCVVGAFAAMRRFSRADRRPYGDVLLLCTLGGLIAGIAVVPAAYKQYYLMPLPIACVFAARGLCFLVEKARERFQGPLLVGATAVLLIWPTVELGKSFVRRDDRQAARLRYVFEHTRPEDPVLDGWLGTAVFRPHPLPYFFMHREVLAMLSDAELDRYFRPLESGAVRPALITLDDELRAMGPRFMRFLQTNYVSRDGMFYVPAR